MESIKVKGIIEVWEGKKEKKVAEYENLFLQSGLNILFNALQGSTTGIEGNGYSYFVIGTGTDEVKKEDMTLSNETFRKGISSIYVYPNKIVIDSFIDTNEANFNWTEIGLVAGGTLEGKDSGVLLNRALVKEEKNNGKSKTITWSLIFN